MKTWNHRRRIKTEDKGRVVAFQGSLLQLLCRDVAFQGSLLQLRCGVVTFREAKKLLHTHAAQLYSDSVVNF